MAKELREKGRLLKKKSGVRSTTIPVRETVSIERLSLVASILPGL